MNPRNTAAVIALTALASAGCASVTGPARQAFGTAVDKTADATRATVGATKATFAKTRDFLIPWGRDGDGAPPPGTVPKAVPVGSLAVASPTPATTPAPAPAPEPADPEAPAPAGHDNGREAELAEARAQDEAVRRATLTPASFGGATGDRSGLWAVEGWQVRADEAWLERDGSGEVAKFLARGNVVATRDTEPERTVIEATSFSVVPSEGMLVTECQRVTQGDYQIRAAGRSMTVAVRSDGAISINGPSESRYVRGSG